MIQRLSQDHEQALEELLETDPVVNLFLLGFLGVHPVDRAWWYGAIDGDYVRGAVLILPGRLCVPWIPRPRDRAPLGRHLAALHRPCMTVGPRAQVDDLWEEWAVGAEPMRYYAQRLYTLHEPPPGPPEAGFRRARFDDWRPVAVNAGLMEEEDLGHNPYEANPKLHEQVVQERVKSGRTWILERDSEIVFQINIGTVTPWGCQIGGTYVPTAHRGHGYATRGVAETCRRLLARHPLVTLHVNEANTPAVRVYEKVGFQLGEPFRLITV